jgi:hypothetical protein
MSRIIDSGADMTMFGQVINLEVTYDSFRRR